MIILLKQDINFISKNSGVKVNRLKSYIVRIVPILIVALIIIFAHLWSASSIQNLKQESEEIASETRMLKEQIQALDQERIQRVQLQEDDVPPRSEVIELIYKERNVVTPMMNSILQYIPEDVYITGIRISNQNQMNVDFVVPSTIHALRLVFSFNNSGILSDELALPALTLGESRRTMSLNLRLRS